MKSCINIFFFDNDCLSLIFLLWFFIQICIYLYTSFSKTKIWLLHRLVILWASLFILMLIYVCIFSVISSSISSGKGREKLQILLTPCHISFSIPCEFRIFIFFRSCSCCFVMSVETLYLNDLPMQCYRCDRNPLLVSSSPRLISSSSPHFLHTFKSPPHHVSSVLSWLIHISTFPTHIQFSSIPPCFFHTSTFPPHFHASSTFPRFLYTSIFVPYLHVSSTPPRFLHTSMFLSDHSTASLPFLRSSCSLQDSWN